MLPTQQFSDGKRNERRNAVAHPLAVACYDQFMGAVYRGDQICGYYTTKMK